MKNQKGFTLIELLVVVAIIGILSGIAFVSISGARESAYDTQIQSELSQVRSNAEQYYYDNGGEYTDYGSSEGWGKIATELPPCSTALLTSSNTGSNSTDHANIDDATTVYQVTVSGQSYAAWAPLCGASTESETHYYCVDSDGNAGEYTGFSSASSTDCGPGGVFSTQVD